MRVRYLAPGLVLPCLLQFVLPTVGLGQTRYPCLRFEDRGIFIEGSSAEGAVVRNERSLHARNSSVRKGKNSSALGRLICMARPSSGGVKSIRLASLLTAMMIISGNEPIGGQVLDGRQCGPEVHLPVQKQEHGVFDRGLLVGVGQRHLHLSCFPQQLRLEHVALHFARCRSHALRADRNCVDDRAQEAQRHGMGACPPGFERAPGTPRVDDLLTLRQAAVGHVDGVLALGPGV